MLARARGIAGRRSQLPLDLFSPLTSKETTTRFTQTLRYNPGRRKAVWPCQGRDTRQYWASTHLCLILLLFMQYVGSHGEKSAAMKTSEKEHAPELGNWESAKAKTTVLETGDIIFQLETLSNMFYILFTRYMRGESPKRTHTRPQVTHDTHHAALLPPAGNKSNSLVTLPDTTLPG